MTAKYANHVVRVLCENLRHAFLLLQSSFGVIVNPKRSPQGLKPAFLWQRNSRHKCLPHPVVAYIHAENALVSACPDTNQLKARLSLVVNVDCL